MTPSATLEPPRAQHHPHIEQPALERAPQLSIVIPAYNESARLPRTLDAILAWLQTRSESWEILVSDDG